ncbi:hypothetical protein KJ359_005841 [Pestalotiopsis sp. 9143b]|nr:hypothetical protein KJ359_005841 [Pestalotiopsis sp. 9143b]
MAVCMLSLAWADAIAGALLPSAAAPDTARTVLVLLSMLLTLAVFVAVQAVQVGLRAMLTDAATPLRQSRANAWASRHVTFSGFLAYFAAYLGSSREDNGNLGGTPRPRSNQASDETQDPPVDNNLGALTPLLYSAVSIFVTFLWGSQSSDDGASFRISDDFALTDRDIWVGSHYIFGTAMVGTFFVSSPFGNVLLFSMVGISWAVTARVPYSLLGQELSRGSSRWSDDAAEASDHQGLVYGLHNLAICLPQILMMALMGVAWLFMPTNDGISGVVWFLRLGGLSAFAAAYAATRLKTKPDAEEKDFTALPLENME